MSPSLSEASRIWDLTTKHAINGPVTLVRHKLNDVSKYLGINFSYDFYAGMII